MLTKANNNKYFPSFVRKQIYNTGFMQRRIIYAVSLCFAILFFVSCSKSSSGDLEIKVDVLSDCVQKGENFQDLARHSTTVHRWIGDNRMEIIRKNVPVACKSAEMKVKAKVVEDSIIVEEEPLKESEDCFCARNFRYVIEEIPSGDYTFVLNGNDYGLIRIY